MEMSKVKKGVMSAFLVIVLVAIAQSFMRNNSKLIPITNMVTMVILPIYLLFKIIGNEDSNIRDKFKVLFMFGIDQIISFFVVAVAFSITYVIASPLVALIILNVKNPLIASFIGFFIFGILMILHNVRYRCFVLYIIMEKSVTYKKALEINKKIVENKYKEISIRMIKEFIAILIIVYVLSFLQRYIRIGGNYKILDVINYVYIMGSYILIVCGHLMNKNKIYQEYKKINL
ncbi:MAG: hypothetical protein N4A47_06615 [Clostridia bacterium]|jgi:hypothetical protein|nr:hypothetical protein [Clostridia bacterium]